jgi:hypothetical protein
VAEEEEERPTRSSKEEAASWGGFGRLGDVACSERKEGNGVKFRMVLRLSTWRLEYHYHRIQQSTIFL